MWQEIIDDLKELLGIVKRKEEPGCYYRIDVVEKPKKEISIANVSCLSTAYIKKRCPVLNL